MNVCAKILLFGLSHDIFVLDEYMELLLTNMDKIALTAMITSDGKRWRSLSRFTKTLDGIKEFRK